MSIAEKLAMVSENVQKVYDAGIGTAYDRFWDEFQQNGTRKNYMYGFGGQGWTANNFKPKYPITITGANGQYMFCCFGRSWSGVDITPDIVDCSQATDASYMFFNANVDTVDIDLGNCQTLTQTFSAPAGGTLQTIVVKLAPVSVSSPFYRAVYLKNLSFKEGSKIGCNGFDFQYSTQLTHDSLLNILHVLEDKSSHTGTPWVITLGASNLAKLTDAEKAIATQKGWTLA